MQIGTLYVNAQGAKLANIGERLLVRSKEGAILQDVPFFRIRQVICFGSVEITCRTIFQLMRRQIDVVYLTLKGRFKCRLSNLNSRVVIARTMQYRRSFESSFILETAKSIVKGKLTNYRNWIQSRNRRALMNCASELGALNESLKFADSAVAVDELMGIEGNGSKIYFSVFRQNLRQKLDFDERNRRPPRDPVNALLSFGYTILLQKILAAVETAGLDPFLANLHANQNYRPSLALDLIEEFRLFCVDNVVSRIVNLVQVKPDDFTATAEKGVRMNENTIALLVKEIQARMSSYYFYPREKRKVQLQDILLKQAYQYRDVVLGEQERYEPMIFTY